MPKLPAIQLYPGDWYRDDVSGCSLAAQGLWLRMMFIGHDADRYGYLAKNGSPIPPESIARRCGCTPAQYETLLAELEVSGVFSRTPEGVIYCRRMVRDAETRTSTKKRVNKHRNKKRLSNGDVTPQYEDESEDEKEVEVSSSQKEKAQAFFLRIQELGFRDSRSVVAQSEYVDRLADHGDTPESILERLSRIYRWTQNGVFAPRLSEVIRRCDEPQELWERKDAETKRPTAKETFDNFGYYRCDCGYQFLPDGKTECPGCEKPLRPQEAVAGAKGTAVGRKA